MKRVIILFGKPGAGKGTRLSEFLEGRDEQFETLSVSTLLKKARKDQTEIGKTAAIYMDSGKLVPDEIICKIVIEAMHKSTKTVIIDGFPRTVKQAEVMFETGLYPDIVINFDVDDNIVIQRAKDRLVCDVCGEPYTTNNFKRPKIEGICDKCGGNLIRRKDDNEEIVKNRLKVYHTETLPALDVFKNRNIKIFTIDNTSEDAGEKFKELLI